MTENKIKIMVAEDDRFLSSLLRAKLQKEGFEVRTVYDGEEAIGALREYRPDTIILDLIMPRISGFEFLETVSVDPQFNQIPMIVMSNLGQDTDVARARELGVAEYFVKSQTSIDEVIRTVHDLLRAKGRLEDGGAGATEAPHEESSQPAPTPMPGPLKSA